MHDALALVRSVDGKPTREFEGIGGSWASRSV